MEGRERLKQRLIRLHSAFDTPDYSLTPLEICRTSLFHIGNRLQEISEFSLSLIQDELISYCKTLRADSHFMDSYYVLPKNKRDDLCSKLLYIADQLATEKKWFVFKKYEPKVVTSQELSDMGLFLVKLSEFIYVLFQHYGKRQP
jgi:hypothetical protein